jgi:mono/diheme cytochrome c family protein
MRFVNPVVAVVVLVGIAGEVPAQVPDKIDFGRDVFPLFKVHCIDCHGPKQHWWL